MSTDQTTQTDLQQRDVTDLELKILRSDGLDPSGWTTVPAEDLHDLLVYAVTADAYADPDEELLSSLARVVYTLE